jgi:predicted transcriptional regulator of viral defense system
MSPAQEAKLKRLGIFTLAQANKVGVHQSSLSRLVKKGTLQRVRRGIYLHPKAHISANEIEFQIAQAKFGNKAAIGGLSALFHYNLVEQVPGQTWVIVRSGVHTAERSYRLMRTKTDINVGIVEQDGYRIASIERALIEALRYSSKIGERTALKAVRIALTKRLTTEAKLGQMAKALKLESSLVRYFEAIAL